MTKHSPSPSPPHLLVPSLSYSQEKIRIVLNKSDGIEQQQLMRVYGALMWALGKVFRNPEVCRRAISGAARPPGA